MEEITYPSSYRETEISKTLYCVTSVYTGEKGLGMTLEKLAVREILELMTEEERRE